MTPIDDQTDMDDPRVPGCPGREEHEWQSIKTDGRSVPWVERCLHCGLIDGAKLDYFADAAVKRSLTDRAKRIAIAADLEPFAFVTGSGMDLRIEEIVGQALGAVSVSWKPRPTTEVFDSSHASRIFTALMAEIERAAQIREQAALEGAQRRIGVYLEINFPSAVTKEEILDRVFPAKVPD